MHSRRVGYTDFGVDILILSILPIGYEVILLRIKNVKPKIENLRKSSVWPTYVKNNSAII